MKYTIAEIADKLSIIYIKKDITSDEKVLSNLEHQTNVIAPYLAPYKSKEFDAIFDNLYKVNKQIFHLIDFFLKSEDYYEMGVKSKECQVLNLKRSSLKKEIDILLGVSEKDMEIKI